MIHNLQLLTQHLKLLLLFQKFYSSLCLLHFKCIRNARNFSTTINLTKDTKSQYPIWIHFNHCSEMVKPLCYIGFCFTENCKNSRITKLDFFCFVLLADAAKEWVLIDHLLQAQAGIPVFVSLTLFCCRPILNPGSLTNYVLESEKNNWKKNSVCVTNQQNTE